MQSLVLGDTDIRGKSDHSFRGIPADVRHTNIRSIL